MKAENTSLCYLIRGDSYLLLHRIKKQNDCNAGKWIGVGGHFEDGESPEDCMKREVVEETGITVKGWRYRGIVTFVSDGYTEYMHLFTSDDFEGVMRECDEGVLRWVARDEMKSLPMWEGDRVFLSLLEQDIPFFSLKLVYSGERLVTAELDGKPAEL